jgi:hypothetical protein
LLKAIYFQKAGQISFKQLTNLDLHTNIRKLDGVSNANAIAAA